MARVCLLFSYAHLKGRLRRLGKGGVFELARVADVLIDSGAFTDFAAGRSAAAAGKEYRPIGVREYIGWCAEAHGKVWEYVALDAIRDPAGTRRNLDAMNDAGLTPMPVLVEGESYDAMPGLVARSPTRRVCVAGGVGSGAPYIWARFRRAYAASGDAALIHGLGFLRWPACFALPLASGDSCSFAAGGQFGALTFYDPRSGFSYLRGDDLRRGDAHRDPARRAALSRLRLMGVPFAALADPARYRSGLGLPYLTSVVAHLEFMRDAATKGFRAFLAIAGSWHLRAIASAAAARAAAAGGVVRLDVMGDEFRRLNGLNNTRPDAALEAIAADLEAAT